MYICTRIYIHTTELDFIIPTTFGKSLPYTFRENRVLFSSLVRSLWWVQIIGYFSACRSHSFVCTLLHPRDSISLSLVCKHIWRHCNICNIWGCVLQFTHFPCDDWENKYIYIYLSYHHHHHQIGSMNYYPLFRVRSWNNGMRWMSAYILTVIEGMLKHFPWRYVE